MDRLILARDDSRRRPRRCALGRASGGSPAWVLAACGLALVVPLVGAGCGGGPEVREKTYEELRAEQVGEFMLHLNNESRSERWRESLIEVGRRSPEDRDYVLRECQRAYDESMARGGVGTGVLRAPGRRRVMEVVSQLDDLPASRAVLAAGLKDLPEVAIVAAAGLAAWGDERALPVLIRGVVEADALNPSRKVGVEALRRLADPSRRDTFLNALSEAGFDALAPVALRTFPSEPSARAPVLREVAATHPNPWARVLALKTLVEEKDAQATALARRALDEGDSVVRPTALAALGASGGNRVAEELERVLRGDPTDVDDVVRGLFEVGTGETVIRALNLLGDSEVAARTRAAVARGFFGRFEEPAAPAAYRTERARADARSGLRDALGARDEQVVAAAVEALGQIGARTTDVEPLLVLLREPNPRIAPAVVTALGRLGGEFAASRLLDLVRSDPALREPAAKALGTFAEPRDVPVHDLIDLLEEDDAAARRAALTALLALSGANDKMGYDPDARDEAKRREGAQRWRSWWEARH